MSKSTSLFLLVFLLSYQSAIAHVEKGNMPDSVAEMEYRILLEFNPKDHKSRSLLGMSLLRQNKLSEAENEFRLLLKTEPKNFDFLDSLGLILLKQKRTPEALQYLKTAISINPDDIMVHLHLGRALANSGQIEEARKILTSGSSLINKLPQSDLREEQQAEFHSTIASLVSRSSIEPKK